MRVEELKRLRDRLPGSGWRAARRWTVVFVAVGALLVGAVASAVAWLGDGERIARYWTHAALDETGEAHVVEVIDYDFGRHDRHGIIRELPTPPNPTGISVESPTAPDEVLVTPTSRVLRVRIGDPDITITGLHRYRIGYDTGTLVRDDIISWNAVGTGWDVRTDEVEIHVTAPYELDDLKCDQGRRHAEGGCTAREVEAGHVVVETSGLPAHDGVTVTATRGAALDSEPAAPVEPIGSAFGQSYRWLRTGGVAAIATFVSAFVALLVVRWMGRERVWGRDPVSAAMGQADGETGVSTIDVSDLAAMATTEFEAPRELSAAQGGIVHDEHVRERHKTAWLLERAVDGEIRITRDKWRTNIARADETASPENAAILDKMFGERDRFSLGTYDSRFASGWTALDSSLDRWQRVSGLWDSHERRRRRTAQVVGALLATVGIVVVLIGTARLETTGFWLMLTGSVFTGSGFACLIGTPELHRRTPEGSAQWLQVESFRRFLSSSEARHAEAAAQKGHLREYTAWAMSLGELDHWRDVVEEAAEQPGVDLGDLARDVGFVHDSIYLAPSRTAATTKPPPPPRQQSSSRRDRDDSDFDFDFDSGSNHDFGGGGVGSGGGGGGGSSW